MASGVALRHVTSIIQPFPSQTQGFPTLLAAKIGTMLLIKPFINVGHAV